MDTELPCTGWASIPHDPMEGIGPSARPIRPYPDCIQSKLSIPDHSTAFEAGAAKENLKLGLFSYPVLQAADILLYGCDRSLDHRQAANEV